MGLPNLFQVGLFYLECAGLSCGRGRQNCHQSPSGCGYGFAMTLIDVPDFASLLNMPKSLKRSKNLGN